MHWPVSYGAWEDITAMEWEGKEVGHGWEMETVFKEREGCVGEWDTAQPHNACLLQIFFVFSFFLENERGIMGAVSYTHLTLPTKRIV